jgi:hypothetical protein
MMSAECAGYFIDSALIHQSHVIERLERQHIPR